MGLCLPDWQIYSDKSCKRKRERNLIKDFAQKMQKYQINIDLCIFNDYNISKRGEYWEQGGIHLC